MPRGFGNERDSVGDISPANNLAAITPSDDDELAFWSRGIYVGVGGDITLIAAEDSAEVLLKAVPTGTILPIVAKKVMDTGTTATDLVSLY